MDEWTKNVQQLVDEIDVCIREGRDERLTLEYLAGKLGYSPSHVSRRFAHISGMRLRDYLRDRHLAFALREVRDTRRGILDIALEHGFSSHEAFTRAFRRAYGVSPSQYRREPRPVALRTVVRPFDCYLTEGGAQGATDGVQTYFVTIPRHRYLHIRNDRSIGYFDFWQRQSRVPGQDRETICRLLDDIPGKLDDLGSDAPDSGSGHVMAFINEPTGRICSWGIPLVESYGARLPADYRGPIPPQMQIMDVEEGEYIVFEHGAFDYARENALVEAKMERAMRAFDYPASGYALDTTQGRVFYFYHDCQRFWKYIRPVRKTDRMP